MTLVISLQMNLFTTKYTTEYEMGLVRWRDLSFIFFVYFFVVVVSCYLRIEVKLSKLKSNNIIS